VPTEPWEFGRSIMTWPILSAMSRLATLHTESSDSFIAFARRFDCCRAERTKFRRELSSPESQFLFAAHLYINHSVDIRSQR